MKMQKTLNPNANNYVEFLIVHEITHDIATKEMKELILDYAKQDIKFNSYLQEVQNQYGTEDVTDEVVANVCDQLFDTQEFIQSVVEKKPNIFKKILNNIGKLEQRKRPVISGSSVNNGANGSLTNNNIPQSNKNVKSGISNNSNMQNNTKYSKSANVINNYLNNLLSKNSKIIYKETKNTKLN